MLLIGEPDQHKPEFPRLRQPQREQPQVAPPQSKGPAQKVQHAALDHDHRKCQPKDQKWRAKQGGEIDPRPDGDKE